MNNLLPWRWQIDGDTSLGATKASPPNRRFQDQSRQGISKMEERDRREIRLSHTGGRVK